MRVEPLGPDLEIWAAGRASTPHPGDLWVLAWDGEELGAAVIAAVRDTYVLMWPVTQETGRESFPTLFVRGDKTEMSAVLAAWPQAEAGMSTALLDRKIASVFDKATVGRIRRAIYDGGEMPSVTVAPWRDDPLDDAVLKDVICQAQSLSAVEWPDQRIGEVAFDRDLLQERGVDARLLSRILDCPPGQAAGLLSGERLPTEDQARTVAKTIDASFEDLLVPIDLPEVDALVSPKRKALIRRISKERGWPERQARDEALALSLLAARQNPGRTKMEAAAERVDVAITRLLNGE